MKILLLEDDELLSESIIDLLELEGHEIIHTINGYDAEELMIEEEFDLYLLDINVEGNVNGFQLAEELREANDNTKIIFITALTDIESLKRGYDIGITDYIKKPFEPMELVFKIETLSNKNKRKKIIKKENFYYNLNTNEMKIKDKIIYLSKFEKLIFDELILNINEIIDKEYLKEIIDNNNDISLRVLINKIKKKTSLKIINIRGIGYKIEKI
jgi:DNA-binding response OmpR family regulator